MNNPLPEWVSISLACALLIGIMWAFISLNNGTCKKLYGDEWRATGSHLEFCVNMDGQLKGK